jgi:hypothetical protein
VKEPYIYRELTKDDASVDPLQSVDISIFPDKSDLKDIYRLKYMNDMALRKVDLDQ